MLSERQQKLLKVIIESYVYAAQPVSSGFLVGKFNERVSSATIRNEMVALEGAGYIMQPHTSAGRIPTEKAYKFYVENLMELPQQDQDKFELSKVDSREEMKELAKRMAVYTQESIIVAFGKDDLYYTGISNLFSKVEFEDKNLLIDMTRIIDHLEFAIDEVFEQAESIKTFIGQNNPFGTRCSAVICPIVLMDKKSLLVIIGPMRMDYSRVLSIINKISNKLN